MQNKIILKSIFRTIQGEGPLVGTPAIFVRLGGCNLHCPKCDTDYTSSLQVVEAKHVVEAAVLLAAGRIRLMVITGGEPFKQPIEELVERAQGASFTVQIETNGTLYRNIFSPNVVIVCSPKLPKVHPKLVPYVNAYKYVIEHGHVSTVDGLPLRSFGGVEEPPYRPEPRSAEVYLQPCDDRDPEANRANLTAAIQSCYRHGYKLCLQTHKIIGVE